MPTWPLIYLAVQWIIRIVMIPIVMRRRSPSEAMSWLLVVFLIPEVGLFLYLLVGENRLPARRIRRYAAIVKSMQDLRRQPECPLHPPLSDDQKSLIRLAENLEGMPLVGGNDVGLLRDTDQFIDRLIEDIDQATHHVHLLYYIFNTDATGRRVVQAVERAARRGIECRVLADAVGSWGFFGELSGRLQEAGAQVHALLPVTPFRRRLARLDLRNHRKLAVIDGRIAYAGSHNLVDPTYGHKGLIWHDVTARICGPTVHQLQSIFIEDWFSETDELLQGPAYEPRPEICGPIAIQTLPSGPTSPTHSYHRFIVSAIHSADHQVTITSPYLIPDEPLLQALETASRRGVVSQIIVPRQSDQPVTCAAGRAYYQDLLSAGVKVHLHQTGLLHAKTITVDQNIALLGSGNFDIRSFYLNFELTLAMYGEPITARLKDQQQFYISQSQPLDAKVWMNRPLRHRLAQDAAKLLSPLL